MYLKIKVITESKKESIEKLNEDTFEIRLKEKPERGIANSRIIELLQNIYPNTKIRIVSGHHSPSKIVSIG
jgi:uncharacterized protein (TIGR00251 family)